MDTYLLVGCGVGVLGLMVCILGLIVIKLHKMGKIK